MTTDRQTDKRINRAPPTFVGWVPIVFDSESFNSGIFKTTKYTALHFYFLLLFDFINLTQVHTFTASYLPSTFGVSFTGILQVMKRFALSY